MRTRTQERARRAALDEQDERWPCETELLELTDMARALEDDELLERAWGGRLSSRGLGGL